MALRFIWNADDNILLTGHEAYIKEKKVAEAEKKKTKNEKQKADLEKQSADKLEQEQEKLKKRTNSQAITIKWSNHYLS